MRPILAALLLACLAPAATHAMEAGEKGDPKKTDRCIDACIDTQRSCVVKATSIADKTKCTEDNSSCSTKCPLPNGREKQNPH